MAHNNHVYFAFSEKATERTDFSDSTQSIVLILIWYAI